MWLVENELLPCFTQLQLDGFIALGHNCTYPRRRTVQSRFPSSPLCLSASAKPVSVNLRAPLRRREIIFRQTPRASPLPRSPSPSRLMSVPVSRREARFLCAFLSVAATPVSVYPLVLFSRRNVLALFPTGLTQPQRSQAAGSGVPLERPLLASAIERSELGRAVPPQDGAAT